MDTNGNQTALLTPDEMGRADQLTIEAGTPGTVLMERAGQAVVYAILSRWPEPQTVTVLCGPGNNGGDGYVIARLLAQAGWQVDVLSYGQPKPGTDAAWALSNWQGGVRDLSSHVMTSASGLVVDALFGAGLSRDLPEDLQAVIRKVGELGLPVVSVDLPSGIDGANGLVRGAAFEATLSVTFFRKKPGHLLYPGRGHCGDTQVAQIGIGEDVLTEINPKTFENQPPLWLKEWPPRANSSHKFTHGHAVIVSGDEWSTGASRLAAKAALRAGAGLVSVAGSADALRVHANHLTAVMLKPLSADQDLRELLSDRRVTGICIGPALGLDERAHQQVLATLESGVPVVLDADALTIWKSDSEALFAKIAQQDRAVVMTPHDGEFARLFPDLAEDPDKVLKVRRAAKRSGAIVCLKGADTVIGAPDGRIAINCNAPPSLATAGSGDVLAGLICGRLAAGMKAFEAACASVWLHGEAGKVYPEGLTADDLDDALRQVLSSDWRS